MTVARNDVGARPVRAFMQAGAGAIADATVADHVAVAAEAPIAEVARLMCEREIHRVIVVDGGVAVGVVTSFDVLRAFSRARPPGGHTIDYDPSA